MSRFKCPVAVHLFLVKNEEILLLRRFNTGYEDGNYSVIAGHLDGDETYLSAMIREAKEEANITLSTEDLVPIHVMHRSSIDERIDYFFMASSWHGNLKNNEPNKCDDLSWYPIDDLPFNMVPYVKAAIQHYRNNEVFSHFGWEEKK
ncbi:MAG: NUDIX domain-containing protein [Clostridia bacterium]|nr:NUDIX domain-containing protein [Clostridia bacterium]